MRDAVAKAAVSPSAAPGSGGQPVPIQPPPKALRMPRDGIDPLVIGRRIRFFRLQKGLKLEELAAVAGRAASGISAIENGLRSPTLAQIGAIAAALGVAPRALFDPSPPTERDALEIEWERVQRDPAYAARGLPRVKVTRTTSPEVLEALVGLSRELYRVREERVATPEEARRANAALRLEMREQDDYFPELERAAARLLDLAGHEPGEPMNQADLATLTGKLGFELRFVDDLPQTTRSVLDTKRHRLYLPRQAEAVTGDHRSTVLQALASHVLGHGEPEDYMAFLRQRVEANYLAGAVLMPESAAVLALGSAKARRALGIEEFRDAFTVSYEMAAHRFVNLSTRHLGIRVHFAKVHSSGVIHKSYENDGSLFPTDPLGAIEGQFMCRYWAGRTVFEASRPRDRYCQYTDTPRGTFWATAHLKQTRDGIFSVSVGCRLEDAKWFAGADTRVRMRSDCPDPSCCATPPADLAEEWEGWAWPAARPHSSVLAAMPTGAFPGVDLTDVYEFLERQ
ncbi:MAG: helix-turn-helix domain-containing protein [Bifidobacteriaceae bacterium]|jgi:transcriptional regulator with XRE-family HTH domain|nr:helix-turn-helix domain-containing protein [Bifidobacteriaceae bacterium]